jgi:hypothetical protein
MYLCLHITNLLYHLRPFPHTYVSYYTINIFMLQNLFSAVTAYTYHHRIFFFHLHPTLTYAFYLHIRRHTCRILHVGWPSRSGDIKVHKVIWMYIIHILMCTFIWCEYGAPLFFLFFFLSFVGVTLTDISSAYGCHWSRRGRRPTQTNYAILHLKPLTQTCQIIGPHQDSIAREHERTLSPVTATTRSQICSSPTRHKKTN